MSKSFETKIVFNNKFILDSINKLLRSTFLIACIVNLSIKKKFLIYIRLKKNTDHL